MVGGQVSGVLFTANPTTGRRDQILITATWGLGEGVVSVKSSRDLVPWAHDIITQQLASAGSRVMDGDEANAYTHNQAPKGLEDLLLKNLEDL